MNTNLVSIIKGIIAEQGEAVLADPARLKPFIKERAQNVPQDERRAFGRCIEAGAYTGLKNAHTQAERRDVKAAFLPHLQAASGLPVALCRDALDVLEAAVFGVQAAAPPPVYQPPRYTPPNPPPYTPPGQTAQGQVGANPVSGILPAIPRITKRTLIFAIVAGVGAFIGQLLSMPLFRERAGGNAELVIRISLWAGLIGLGISIALIAAQTIYLKKKLVIGKVLVNALRGIVAGAASGAAAQFIYGYTQQVSPVVQVISRVICWGLLGWGLGWGVSFYIPNYPAKRAMLAGFLGGLIGGVVCTTLEYTMLAILSEIMLGFVIGLAISWVEEASRIAWLTLIWGPKETATISLGAKPLIFGSTPEADVYLPHKKGDTKPLPVRAVVSLENGQVVYEDTLVSKIKPPTTRIPGYHVLSAALVFDTAFFRITIHISTFAGTASSLLPI